MNLIDFMAEAIGKANWLVEQAVDGLTDEEMMFQPEEGLNHPIWILGHVVSSANGVVLVRCKGEGMLDGSWHKRFGMGSQPVADAGAYPSRAETLDRMREVNAEKRLVRQVPSESQVQGWVEQAKELPRVVTY